MNIGKLIIRSSYSPRNLERFSICQRVMSTKNRPMANQVSVREKATYK